ncbi:MAG: response regulator [Bacteroidia bacterium]|nr:response regulator [Bacteroidia bacterium]
MAEDDPDDRMLARDALSESKLANDLYFVENGEELMDYLYQRGKYNQENAPRPGLILLDLNMPKKDGREALREIKADPELKRIPVIVLTTSNATEDISKSYDYGVNSFITKPVTFRDLLKVVKTIGNYWFGIVELPENARQSLDTGEFNQPLDN